MPDIRVLMISKACIVGIYQRKLECIAQQGIDLLTLVPPSWRDERGEMPLERAYTAGYRLEVLPLRFNGNFHLHTYRGLGKQIQAFKPHIVHIDEEPYNLAAWQAMWHAKRNGAKTLFFSWQNLHRDYPPPFRWGERWMLRSVDYVIAGTQSAADVWRAKDYTGPITAIPQFGTDTSLFKPVQPPSSHPFTIGFVGRLVREKGVHLLIEAAAGLAGDWQLRILGSGPYLETLKQIARSRKVEDRVIFDAPLPSTQIPAYYHNLDVLVLPSLTYPNWKEQFGRVLVEAMASGVSVIGSQSGAIPDVIGDAGLTFSEGDVSALTTCLEQIRDDAALRDELRHKGRARVQERFTHEQVAAATVQVYQTLMTRV